jgi:hypothetical protein
MEPNGQQIASGPASLWLQAARLPCAVPGPLSAAIDSGDGVISVPSGCALALSLSLLDTYSSVITSLPPAVSAVPVQFSTSSCVSAVRLTVVGALMQHANVSLSGEAGSMVVMQFAGLSPVLASNVITALIESCGPGFESPDPTLSCGRCNDCSIGSFNLNGDGVCRQCPSLVAVCSGAHVWAEQDYWLLYENSSQALVPLQCAPDSCMAACQGENAFEALNCTAPYSIRCMNQSTSTDDGQISASLSLFVCVLHFCRLEMEKELTRCRHVL